jgi:DNA processing protein
MEKHTENIIALANIKGIGASFMKQNLNLISLYKDNLEMLSSLSNKIDENDLHSNILKAREIISDCATHGIKIISYLDADYPKLLLEIKDPPPVLYAKGNLELLDKAIAIIGTRNSTDLGNKIAKKVGDYFSNQWAICNVLVEGIDKNSILNKDAVCSNVIGVISGGLHFEITSSKITKELAKKVLENNGLLLSENEPNKKEDQFSGSKASRIQAGLSKGLILIQSSSNGGSKYTLKTFSELQRPIGVINFNSNTEYSNSDEFSGNRILLSDLNNGLQKICNIKSNELIRTSKIISISGNEDYKIFENSLKI